MNDDADRLLKFADLKPVFGWPYGDIHTRRLWQRGDFPTPFKAGAHGYNLWRKSDLDKYFEDRAKQAKGGKR